MLFEKITYQDDFPINITIANIEEYPIHYHQDIEFVYILKGEVSLKNGYCHYTLKEGDIFTNCGHEVHSMISKDKGNMVALIQISTRFFSQYFPRLSRACYRTYSNHSNTKKDDNLRELLLQILLQYSVKSFNYKRDCTYLMVDTIKCLERYFNLFAFEGDVVINFESGNQTTVERISRIINYIYEHYSERITLDDLADMEHLSTFYLSHIIKNCTGMNFREFLSFARVEWSEIQLLDTNKKVSQIARDVGFSTTAYYEKHFINWFKRTPEEHRAYYKPKVKSELRPEILTLIPANRSISVFKNALSSYNAQKNNTSVINTLKLDLNIDINANKIDIMDFNLDVHITYNDFKNIGLNLLHSLDSLHPTCVTIFVSDEDSQDDVNFLMDVLTRCGYNCYIKNNRITNEIITFANDSIAYSVYIISKMLCSNENKISFRLCDVGDKGGILKGQPSLITTNGIKKTSYYAYQILSLVKGDVISWGKQYCFVRCKDGDKTFYVIIVYNFNDKICNMVVQNTSEHEVRSILNDFNDEIDFNITMNLDIGLYSVSKYTLPRERDVFSYISSLDFPDEIDALGKLPENIYTSPRQVIYTEDVKTTFNINFSLRGAGLQLAIIRPKGDFKYEKE